MIATKEEILLTIVQKSEEHGLDHQLVMAIAEVESNYNQLAIRYEPNWRYLKLVGGYALRLGITANTEQILQSCSLGVLQVMGTKFREHGYVDNLLGIVTDVGLQVEHGCLILKELSTRYKNQDDIIAAYNAGSATKIGPVYTNQIYVDKVKNALNNAQRSII